MNTTVVGRHLVLSGGTRTAVKVQRPWQPKLVFPQPGQCRFCLGQPEAGEYSPAEGWRILPAAYTPHAFHRLLLPTSCWVEDRLRSLGREEALATVLRLALADIEQQRPQLFPTWVLAHVGYGAGQNVVHLHWHLVELGSEPEHLSLDERSFFELINSKQFRVGAHGVRAGQMLIVPQPDVRFSAKTFFQDEVLRQELAQRMAWLVWLFNEKFHFPDYSIILALLGQEDWYVRYTPILNQWGGGEVAAIDAGTPFVLAWPHEETVKFLQQ